MAIYYVSNTGSDSNSALQAQNQSTPWATVAKVSSTNFAAGDQILFKRGDTFTGQLTVTSSGTSSNNIIYGDYGTGTKPVLTGMVPMNLWFSQGSNIWSNPLNAGAALKILTINGTQRWMGRFPKTGWQTITTGGSNTLQGTLPSTPNYNGGQVVIRKRDWVIDRCTITSHSGSTINFTNPTGYPAVAGWGYFVQNHPNTLTTQGDWYYDATNQSLKMYSVGTPSNVKVSTTDRVINIGNKSFVTFNNLIVEGANQDCVHIESGGYLNFVGCDIRLAGTHGYDITFGNNITIDSGTATLCNNQAYYVYQSPSVIIRSNVVTNIGLIPGAGRDSEESSNGMRIDSNSGLVELNSVTNVGYCGINPSGTGITVRKNFITYFCMSHSDGGGIYISDHNNTNKLIEFNIVMYGYGNIDGTPGTQGTQMCAALYSDEADSYTSFNNNLAAFNATAVGSIGAGIYLHKSHHINVTNNILYNNNICQFRISQDVPGPAFNDGNLQAVRNIVFTGNTLISTDPTNYIYHFYSTPSPNLDFSLFFSNINNNVVSKLAGNSNVVHTFVWQTFVETDYTLAQWKTAFSGYDVNSTSAPSAFTTNPPRLEYNNADSPKVVSLDGTYIDTYSSTYANSVSIPAYSSKLLAKTANAAGAVGAIGLRILLV